MSKKETYINHLEEKLINSIYNYKKDLSKKTIKNYIKNKMVKVNNIITTNSSKLVYDNDIIEISLKKENSNNTNLDILYEDDYFIIINKPAGLLSIGNKEEKINTAYRQVSDYVKKTKTSRYIFVVHRLDQDTSGIIMFCKNQKIRDYMQENWNSLVKKRGYLVIVDGIFKGSGTYRSFLKENKQQFVYSSKNNTGKIAITNYQTIKNNNKYTLIQVFLDTGRRNQIRVHFSEHGYPVVGDKKYRCKTNPLKRLCLHANILEFIHPVTKEIITISTKMPKEFNKII